MNVVAEGRATATASAGAQRIGPFRGEDTFVISEAVTAGLGRISLGVKASAFAERDGVTDMLVAENVSTSD